MVWNVTLQNRWRERWREVYGTGAESAFPPLLALLDAYRDLPVSGRTTRWDERDVVLITYGDQITRAGEFPLQTLGHFLQDQGWTALLNILHLLPFYPSTSDDGFAVVDFRDVDERLGQWSDVRRLAQRQDLMVDLVLNHVSRASAWFRQYLAGDPHYIPFFLELDPQVDVSQVTRPRSLPLLTPFATDRGRRHVWTTFSDDQIDLNFAHPNVLLQVLDVLLGYIRQGARIVRLDAVAFLWKELGTSCIHRPQAHAVVRLFRSILDVLAPHVILLTETNVPHRENLSYLGHGDEAHMVYQFSLPPLLLDALLHQDAEPLRTWLGGLEAPQRGTTFFNFTASHDGIGLRPLEGLVSAERIARLVAAAQARGGLISTRRDTDGRDSPYELNLTYFDALADAPPDGRVVTAQHLARFLASQSIMLACRGIPGVYFHSLVGTRNDLQGVRLSGIARRINRRKFTWDELRQALQPGTSWPARVWAAYRHLLQVRIAHRAFHPDGEQRVLPVHDPGILAFVRTSPERDASILVAANVTDRACAVDELRHWTRRAHRELLGAAHVAHDTWTLPPYGVAWWEMDLDAAG
jgi:sucrose phosphorylase